MIFAAGLGTRLRPITDSIPKALVKINGRPLLEWVLLRLLNFGYTEIIINTHHFAEQIMEFLNTRNNFGIRITISNEDTLLDTGGGLKKASWFFNDEAPILLHNVDVISDINLKDMYNHHIQSDALATLAVRDRNTTRYLLFDEQDNLCGWKSLATGESILPRKANIQSSLSFMGIHIISPELLPLLDERQVFPIIETYLRLVNENHIIKAYIDNQCRWLDVGNKENIDKVPDMFDDNFFKAYNIL
jgi:NDP-sugar pyrophosphorylase family protein